MNRRVAQGVPPASSPSVPLGDDPGAEMAPKLAAGTAALRGQARFRIFAPFTTDLTC